MAFLLEDVIRLFREALATHPAIVLLGTPLALIALGLGAIKELRIFARVFLVLVEEGKHELKALVKTMARVRRALTHW